MSQNPESRVDADLQREIDAALGGQSVEDLMNEEAPPAPADDAGEAGATETDPAEDHREFHAEMKRGRIAAIRGEDVFVELTGEGKLQGVVPVRQFDRQPRIGSIMDFVVDHVDEDQGLVFLSREGAVSRATWEQLQRGAVVDARVIATNKGGLELEMVGGIRAFMPASQIDMHHVGELEPFVGQKLEGMVQEIDRKSKKVVLSRRAMLEHRRAQQREKVLKELAVGQIREGTVSNILDFGAFVDLGGVDGLVHVTDLAYAHVNHPREVVKPGDKVRVKVLKIDPEKDRISLGMKQVEPDPWENVEGKYEVGKTVEGTVSRTANFGAFIELEPGIDGLLPMSEMSWQRIGKAEDVVKAGDRIRVSVIHVDPAKKRLTLSLKQVGGDPWIGAEHKYARHSVVPGTVKSVTDFGAFVELEPGVEGLVHISELSHQRVGRVEDVVNVGDTKDFRILEISEDDRKVRLSLKQAQESAAPQGGQQSSGGPRKSDLPRKARQQPRKDLKSGLGDVGAIGGGMGLGNLRLDNLKYDDPSRSLTDHTAAQLSPAPRATGR